MLLRIHFNLHFFNGKIQATTANMLLRLSTAALRNHVRCQSMRPMTTRITTPNGTELHLPEAEDAVGPYRKCLEVDGLLYTSTHFGTDADNVIVKGRVDPFHSSLPRDCPGAVSTSEAKLLARGAGLRLLATVHRHLEGDLSRVEQVVKLTGLVNGAEDFEAHGAVIDGCSELLVEAFGEEKGVGTRVCSGSGSLGCVVTCDVVIKIAPRA